MLSFNRELKIDVHALELDDCVQILGLPLVSNVTLPKLLKYSGYFLIYKGEW